LKVNAARLPRCSAICAASRAFVKPPPNCCATTTQRLAKSSSIADPKAFRSGRDFSAWIGLVPKQNSSGGKHKLGNISKRGDRYLRSLFTAGALAVIRYAKIHGTKHRPWLVALLARRPTKVAAIALANKLARIAWALMTKGSRYRQPAALRV
jgi:transposase